jgi:hypothetical protein
MVPGGRPVIMVPGGRPVIMVPGGHRVSRQWARGVDCSGGSGRDVRLGPRGLAKGL